MNFHTHDLQSPMQAIINMPMEWMLHPTEVKLRTDATYSVGVHPWWTAEENVEDIVKGFLHWATHPQVVRIGECGIDKLKGAPEAVQTELFLQHVALSEQLQKPLTIHCVRAFDQMLMLRKRLRPTQRWAIHGFRGKPALAQQLLVAGFDLSFGTLFNAESFNLCPPERRFTETD